MKQNKSLLILAVVLMPLWIWLTPLIFVALIAMMFALAMRQFVSSVYSGISNSNLGSRVYGLKEVLRFHRA